MFQIKALCNSVCAEPISVQDDFGQGWQFFCRGANTRRFKALRNPYAAIATRHSAELLANYSQKAIQECQAAGEQFLASLEGNEDGENEKQKSANGMSDDARRLYSQQLISQAEHAQELAAAEPPIAKEVAALVKDWRGIKDEKGAEVPYSEKNVNKLLALTTAVPTGQFEGDEIGKALRTWIPNEIMRISAEREAQVASNSKNSSGEPSGGNGSTTDQEIKTSEDSGT